jgi:hypothetical protein
VEVAMGVNQSINFYPAGVISFETNEMARYLKVRELLGLPDNPESDRYVRVDEAILDDERVQHLVDLVFDAKEKGDYFIAIDRRTEYCGPVIEPTPLKKFPAELL